MRYTVIFSGETSDDDLTGVEADSKAFGSVLAQRGRLLAARVQRTDPPSQRAVPTNVAVADPAEAAAAVSALSERMAKVASDVEVSAAPAIAVDHDAQFAAATARRDALLKAEADERAARKEAAAKRLADRKAARNEA